MFKRTAPDYIGNEYATCQYEGFNWRYRKVLNIHNQLDFDIWGPFCVCKKCSFGEMREIESNKYKCIHCGYENSYISASGSDLISVIKSRIHGEWAKGLKFSNFDKLPAINEKLEEKNKFYKISVEHSKLGDLRDVHILIGRKDNDGKKAHIIISPDGEIRLDKKDLHPSEEIKSIGFVIYKDKK